MEAASSIAGLISVAGLVLEGIQTLRTFCLDFKAAGSDVQETADDLRGLGSALEQLEQVHHHEGLQPSTVTLLRRAVINCKEDVDKWLRAIKNARYHDKKGFQRVLKRLGATLDCGRRGELRQKISSHRGQLTLALELLGRDVDNHNREQLSAIRATQKDHHERSMHCLELGFGKLELSQASLNNIEYRLESVQRTLTRAVAQKTKRSARRPKTGRSWRQPQRWSSATQCMDSRSPSEAMCATSGEDTQGSGASYALMRLVKTAYLVQESNGRAMIEMLATTDENFERADIETKITMIKYIQGLRLLTWLLRRDNFAYTARYFANDDSASGLVRVGSLNARYKRLTVPLEFLRWKQFSLISKQFSPLYGGIVPHKAVEIVHSYFLSNEYGRDLFRFYLSLRRTGDDFDVFEPFGPDSNDPAWIEPTQERIALFSQYLNGGPWPPVSRQTSEPALLEKGTANSSDVYDTPLNTLQKSNIFDSAFDVSNDSGVESSATTAEPPKGSHSETCSHGHAFTSQSHATKYSLVQPRLDQPVFFPERSGNGDNLLAMEMEAANPEFSSIRSSSYANPSSTSQGLGISRTTWNNQCLKLLLRDENAAAQPLRESLLAGEQSQVPQRRCKGAHEEERAECDSKKGPLYRRCEQNRIAQRKSAQRLRTRLISSPPCSSSKNGQPCHQVVRKAPALDIEGTQKEVRHINSISSNQEQPNSYQLKFSPRSDSHKPNFLPRNIPFAAKSKDTHVDDVETSTKGIIPGAAATNFQPQMLSAERLYGQLVSKPHSATETSVGPPNPSSCSSNSEAVIDEEVQDKPTLAHGKVPAFSPPYPNVPSKRRGSYFDNNRTMKKQAHWMSNGMAQLESAVRLYGQLEPKSNYGRTTCAGPPHSDLPPPRQQPTGMNQPKPYSGSTNTSSPLVPDQRGGRLGEYEMQLKLLEQQNRRRLAMAREEQASLSKSGEAAQMRRARSVIPGRSGDLPNLYIRNVLGGWRDQLSMDDRARYGTLLLTVMQQIRSKFCSSKKTSDSDLWQAAMNIEADVYVNAKDLASYHGAMSANQSSLVALGRRSKVVNWMDSSTVNLYTPGSYYENQRPQPSAARILLQLLSSNNDVQQGHAAPADFQSQAAQVPERTYTPTSYLQSPFRDNFRSSQLSMNQIMQSSAAVKLHNDLADGR